MSVTNLQLRRDTYATWMSNNPILSEGEPAYETDTGRYKIGDGATTYALLHYSTRQVCSMGLKSGKISNFGEFQSYLYSIPRNPASTVTVTPYTHGATVVATAYVGATFSPTQNRIYFSPYSQSTAVVWHYIDCTVSSVLITPYTHGATTVSIGYIGGTYFPKYNRIYLNPYGQATSGGWHYIDCSVSSVLVSAYGSWYYPSDILSAYVGGAFHPGIGRLYFIPAAGQAQAYYSIIDQTGAANGVASATVAVISRGGCYSPTLDRLYFVPYTGATSVVWQYVDNTGAIISYSHCISLLAALWPGGAYEGGVFSPLQNRIYFIPYGIGSFAAWHYIDCINGSVVAYTHGATAVVNAYRGGVYCPTENRIYMVPNAQSTATLWHYINCDTGSVVAYTHGATVVVTAYAGGCYCPSQNRTYFAPASQATATVWHYIDHGESMSGINGVYPSKWVMSAALFNKY